MGLTDRSAQYGKSRGAFRRQSQRNAGCAREQASQRHQQLMNEAGAADQVEQPRLRRFTRTGVVHAELVGPSHQRAKQQLVVGQNHQRHGHDDPGDRSQVFLRDSLCQKCTHTRQVKRLVTHRDGFGCDHEKPCARHRHHHVPDETGHGKRHLQLPESLPGRQVKAARNFIQIARDGAQRLVKTEGHVPGLAGENGEYCRQFSAEHTSWEECHEKRDGKRDVTQHRYRLQDIEHRHQHFAGAFAFGRQRAITKSEQQRNNHGSQHAKGRECRVPR